MAAFFLFDDLDLGGRADLGTPQLRCGQQAK
jgi:hypothetical protein